MGYAGNYRYFTYASWVLSAVSALVALVPFVYIWKILRDVLDAAPNYAQAVNIPHYGWMAVLFAVLAYLIYIAALMCSHLSAFRVATNLRLAVSEHLAVLSLGFGVVAGLTRYTRAELSEVLTGDYMLLARTKGLTKAQAISRHALRNAMVVILPMIIGEFIGILGGSMIIENIFGIPGIGNLYINSINVRDYNFFMALNVFYTAIGLVSGIVIDISYGFIDPRIRMGSKK